MPSDTRTECIETENDCVVSVIVPAWNAERFLKSALLSVAAQTVDNFETIVVDDGSTDGTAAVLDALAATWSAGRGLRVLRQANAGAAAARNAGVTMARGAHVAFLDADDRWAPELLETLLADLARCPDADLAFPRVRYVDEAGAPIGITSRAKGGRLGLADLLVDPPIHSATGVVVRRAAFDRAGGFDPELTACIDLDCWFRIAAGAGAGANVIGSAAVLADYRRRDGQITEDWRRMEENWIRVLAKLEDGAVTRAATAHQTLYWSALAYARGDYADARRLVARAWRLAPMSLARRRQAWVRAAACATSVLPQGMHNRLARGFNRVRARLGIDLS